MIVRLRHVKRVRAKGKYYWYHRVTRDRLPDDREDRAARVLDINRTLKGTARKIALGSLDDVARQYKKSPEFTRLRDQTRHEYLIYLGILTATWGAQPIATIERKHILALRDKYAETPARPTRLSPSCVSSWPSRWIGITGETTRRWESRSSKWGRAIHPGPMRRLTPSWRRRRR